MLTMNTTEHYNNNTSEAICIAYRHNLAIEKSQALNRDLTEVFSSSLRLQCSLFYPGVLYKTDTPTHTRIIGLRTSESCSNGFYDDARVIIIIIMDDAF